MITGYADQKQQAKAEELKASAYLFKPFDNDELLDAVRKNIG